MLGGCCNTLGEEIGYEGVVSWTDLTLLVVTEGEITDIEKRE